MDWKEALENLHKKYIQSQESQGFGTFPKFEQALSSGTAPSPEPKMADGGMVSPPDVPPEIPDLNAMSQSMQSTPPTDYSFYKNISAEDRAALAQQLLQQQHSGGNLVAQGISGIGDAIANSYGGQHTTYQKNAVDVAKEAAAQKLSNFDTQRGQKMQDFQGNISMQENDPNSPLSKQGRDFFTQNGVQTPSGMSFAQLKTLAPSMADLVKGKWENSFKEASLAAQQQQNATANQLHEDELKRQEKSDAVTAQDKGEEIKKQNLEELGKHGVIWKQFHPTEAGALEQGAGLGQNSLAFSDKDKEAKYQAWKAKQMGQ